MNQSPPTHPELELVKAEYDTGRVSALEGIPVEPVRFVPAGNKVLVLVRQAGRERGAHVWTVRDQGPVDYRVYTDELEALADLEGVRTLQAI